MKTSRCAWGVQDPICLSRTIQTIMFEKAGAN
jgi:hypothetical protein